MTAPDRPTLDAARAGGISLEALLIMVRECEALQARAEKAEATAALLRAGLTEALYEMGDDARDYFTSQFLEATP